ncbi:MAG: terminase family protein, partial [Patescibacteria group bacterium]|nr:terminase family protein [Patescibacteria group bacterium]
MAIPKGCPQDQVLNYFRGNWFGEERQMEMAAAARACDVRCPSCQAEYNAGRPIKSGCTDCGPRKIGVGGARGGGKSAWMFAQVCLDDCQRYPGLKFLYVRKSGKSLRQQVRDLLQKTFPAHSESNPLYHYREQFGEIHFPNGSFIIIGHFKDESEIDNYLGQEYDGIAYEELTTLTKDKYDNLNSCLRTSKKGWRPRLYAAWNWGGIGHSWVLKEFYEPWEEKREVETRYILALARDNSHNNPEYINDMQKWQ